MKPDSMDELQHQWYKALTAQLGLDEALFQLSLPAAPLAQRDDAVWDCGDTIPPDSFSFNRQLQKSPRFSTQYAAVVNLTGGISEALESVIGKEAYAKWSTFLQEGPRPLDEWPDSFLKWAMPRFPAVATAGASALARSILETAAESGMPHEYRGTYRELREELRAAGGGAVSFHSGDVMASTSDASPAALTAVDGLWAGGLPDSPLCRKFARSEVAVEVRFERYAISRSQPGPWYREVALRAAFENAGSPPWPAAHSPLWNNFFGRDGSMSRAIDSLVVVDGIDATMACDADFLPQERAMLESNAVKGVWPFYAASSELVTNQVAFHGSGSMQVRIVTKPGNPAVVGNNVLSIARYLGRSGGLAMHP